MKKRILSVLTLAAMTMAIFAGCGSSDNSSGSAGNVSSTGSVASSSKGGSEYTMIAGVSTPDNHPYALGLNKIGELVSEKTNGAVGLDVFGNSQLGNERDLIEGLQLGSVQMTCVSTAPLSGFTDMFLVFDLPFIFETTEQARAVMDSEVGDQILHSLDEQGLEGLAWFENGFRNVTNNVKPITVPDDLKGIKIRTMENQMHMAAFKAMGADPTPMAMGDVFTALQQGTIDAEENPVPIIETNKFGEVQKYLSMTGHLFSPAPVFISKDYFDSLPAEYQTAVQEAATEAVSYQREQIDEQNVSGLESLKSVGMEVNEVEKQPFKDATQVVYTDYIKDAASCVSLDIYSQVEEIVAQHTAQ